MKRKIKLTAAALCVTMLSTLTVTPIMAAKNEDYIDAFGRSWKRVEGGTYYAEETAANTFTNRISTYPCPNNNGGKHDLQYHKQAPDCENGDSNYYVCTLCGEREIILDFPALGHKYESRISRQPAPGREGEEVFTCSRCGDQYTQPIPALDEVDEDQITKDPNAVAATSDNLGAHNYGYHWSQPVNSYLYQRNDGTLTRVEHVDGSVAVETYRMENAGQDMTLLTAGTLPMELPIFGGFYAGTLYNFLIFGQENPGESDNTEVIRVVKYSKNWDRLGHASLYGANTYIPFESGSLRCAEFNGMLYVQTCHQMYADYKGVNHQANLIFSLRQSDMTITDQQTAVNISSTGYISHSFNQFILVDDSGRLVTLNHGDALPRGAILSRYHLPAGRESFVDRQVKNICIRPFSENPTNYNMTGAGLGGFETAAGGYLAALNIVPQSGTPSQWKTRNVELVFVDNSLSSNKIVKLTNYAEGGEVSAGVPHLVKMSNNRFLVMWTEDTLQYGYYNPGSRLAYAFVNGQGQLQGQIRYATAPLSDCQPIVSNGDVLWYTTNDSAPVFYTLDESGVTAHHITGSTDTPTKPVKPTDPTKPVKPTDPTKPVKPTDPTKPVKPTDPTKPVKPTDPTKPVKPTDPTKPGTEIAMRGGNATVVAFGNKVIAVQADGTLVRWELDQDCKFAVKQQIAGSGYVAVSNSSGCFFALKDDGTLWTFGTWYGHGSDEAGTIETPIKVLDHVKQISGDTVLKTDGSVWVPSSYFDDIPDNSPYVKIMDDVVQISTYGSENAFAVKKNGELWSWCFGLGCSMLGREGSISSNGIPGKVMDDVAFVSGDMAVKTDGSLWVWGDAIYGNLGDETYPHASSITPVRRMEHVVDAWSPSSGINFVRTSDGTLYSWGANDHGQLGYTEYNSAEDYGILRPQDDVVPVMSTPTPVDFTGAVQALELSDINLLLKDDGTLWKIYNATFTKVADGLMLPNTTQRETETAKSTFTDVPKTHWAYSAINYAAEQKWVSGVGGGKFLPKGTVTGAEWVTMVVRCIYGDEVRNNGGAHWYTPYVNVANEHDLLRNTGVSANDSASICKPFTRTQMAVVMNNIITDQGLTLSAQEMQEVRARIPDIDQVPQSMQNDVISVYCYGLLAGVDQRGTFAGNAKMDRAQAAVVLGSLNEFLSLKMQDAG